MLIEQIMSRSRGTMCIAGLDSRVLTIRGLWHHISPDSLGKKKAREKGDPSSVRRYREPHAVSRSLSGKLDPVGDRQVVWRDF